MPIINVEGVGQVNFPDTMSPEQISDAIQKDILPQFPEIAAQQSRTMGEIGTDILASVGAGIGSLAQIPGQVTGLVTGKVSPDTGLEGLGRKLQAYAEEAKSTPIKAREALRSQKIEQADGVLKQAGVAIAETLKDPSLLSSFIFEQAPQLIGTMGGGVITRQGIKILMRNATEEVLAKSGTRGAIGTGAIMQGADIGTDTYERIYNERMMQGYPEEKAREEALAGGRKAAVEAAALTGLTSIGPGGTIERALTRGAAGAPKTGIIKGTLGEILGESIEEGGGKLASNIEFQKVKPEADIMEGVGAAAGMGALGGGLFGLPSSFVNKANALELERAKKMVEDAKKRAAESNQPQEVQLQLGYDPTVEGSGIYTPIIVNPDGTTTFPSERNQFAQVVPGELSEEGFAEKYGIPTKAQLKDRTFTAETIKGFGISPKANLYRNLEILDKDIANPENAKKIKTELQAYLSKYPNVNPKIRKNIMDYLARPEFQEKPTFPTQITSASLTPEADEAAVQQRIIEGFKNRPEIQKIYEDYNKLVAEQDADKAALSAFNSVVTPQTIKSLGFKYGSQPFNDQDLVNADLTNPEVADMVRAKLTALRDQTKSTKIKENIDKYLNRSEFITPSFVDQYLNPPRTEAEQNMEHFVFLNNEGNIESKYGTITERDGKRFAKYAENKGQKGGERELTENVFVNPTPDQIELLSLYKARDQLMKEPDDFKSWLIQRGVDPKERADIGIEKRLPHKMFREGGHSLDDLIRMAIEDGILHEPDFREGVGGVESMRDYIKMAVDGDFIPTANNMRNMNDLENIQRQIEYIENKTKGVPEEEVAQEFIEPTESPVTPEVTEEVPKKRNTAKTILAGMEAKELELKNLPKEGMTPEQLEVMDMADQIEAAGEPGFATAMRSNVANNRIDEKALTFYRERLQQYLAQQGQATGPVTEEFDINKYVEGFDKDQGRLRDQNDFFGTKTSSTVAKSNDYIKRLAKAINDAGFKFEDVNATSPMEVQQYKRKMSQIAGSTMRLMKEQEALDKGYKRADIEKHGKTLDTLEKDFAEVDEMLGEAPQASKATMEGKPKATPEQIKNAELVANEFKGGEVAWQDGDLALIRVFSALSGDPIYIPSKGTRYVNKSVATDFSKVINNPLTKEEIARLIVAKDRLEAERKKAAAKKNEFIQFDKDGVAISKDIDPKLAGIIAEWKKLFGLKNNIYISTTEDAIANRDKFTGPYERIVHSTFNKNENGVTQLLANGERYVLFQKSTSITKMLEVLAHEFGHAHQQEVFNNASPAVQKQIRAEYEKWLAKQKTATARELLKSLRAKKTAETTTLTDEGMMASDLQGYNSYWTSFSEWYADQVSRWATTSEKPLSVVDKFFAKIANGLRKIFSMLKNQGYLPNETFKAYMDYITSPQAVRNNPINPNPTQTDQEVLFSKSTMKASFEGVDEAYAEAIKKQFSQEDATVKEKFENLKDNFFEKMVTGLFDEFRAIKKYTTEGYMMARLSKSIDGGLQGLLEHGQVYLNDGALDIRPGTKGLLEILEPLGSEVDQYQIWKALSRDAQMPADKRSFDPALVAGRDNLTKGTINGKSRKEVYEKARLEENALNKSVLDVALETGLIDRQAYQVFSNDINYIPFYKMMEDGDVNSVSASSKLTGQYFSKALKGGDKKTNDLMENVLLNWSHILSASMKNQAALKTVQAAENLGAAEKAKPMDGKYPPGTIKLMENGKLTHYTLTDPDLVDAISTISYLGPKSAFLNVAKGFTNALRYGVTLSPAYKVRNLIRDSLQSASVSELGANMFENVYNGLRMSKKGDPTFMAALAGGGIFEMGTAHEGDQARLIKRLIDKGIKEATILDTPEKIKGKLQDLLDSYNELGNKFENANRLALYKKLRESGKSHLEASFAARDLMDFSMQGQFRAVKVIASVVPFFNARLQGLYKLGRDGITPTYRVICNATTGAELKIGDKEKAQRFMVMSSAIALASILLYGAYKDDEDFKRREDWDRDNFWWFKIGTTQFRIPKPFEIGAFGTIAERTYEQIADDSVEGKVFANRLNAILMDTFSLNPVPQMIKPLIDIYANKDSFTGAPIESAGMERLSKQERLTNKTSGVAIALGGISSGAAKVLTFNPDAEGFSPVQMDYAIKAYLGWLGATAVSTADLATEPFKEGTRVRPPIIDTVAMGFIKTEPQTQSKYMTQFYQNNARLQSALADMRHYAEIGDMEKVTKIMEEKGDDIALSKVYDKATKQLAQLRKQSRMIEQNKDISTDDKRAEMNRIKILMSDIAKEMETIRKTR